MLSVVHPRAASRCVLSALSGELPCAGLQEQAQNASPRRVSVSAPSDDSLRPRQFHDPCLPLRPVRSLAQALRVELWGGPGWEGGGWGGAVLDGLGLYGSNNRLGKGKTVPCDACWSGARGKVRRGAFCHPPRVVPGLLGAQRSGRCLWQSGAATQTAACLASLQTTSLML